MDGSVTVPKSVFCNGQWATAHWMADVVDAETGELIITATLAGEAGQGPVVTALRMDMDLARQLREMARNGAVAECYDCRTTGERIDAIEAGLPPQFQVEARRMRARMRYVADVLRSARMLVDTPMEDEVDGLLLHAIGQLRMADGKDGADGSDEGRCYDCRTTGDRLAELERRLDELDEYVKGFEKATARLDGRLIRRIEAIEGASRSNGVYVQIESLSPERKEHVMALVAQYYREQEDGA